MNLLEHYIEEIYKEKDVVYDGLRIRARILGYE